MVAKFESSKKADINIDNNLILPNVLSVPGSHFNLSYVPTYIKNVHSPM